MKRIFIVVVFVSLLVISCAGEHPQSLDNAKDELGGTSVTQYTEKTEIFMEYPALVINDEAKFLIHITDLKDFKAVKQGVLTAEFINDNGEKISIKEDKPARAGIYIPTVIFKNAGNYQMVITLVGNQVSDKIIVENVNVYTSEKEVPSQDEEVNSSISFLKEQQWKIDFANEPVIKRKMQQFVVATGELQAKPELFSKVVSPIQGIVLSKNNRDLKTVGSFVKKGEYLLNISPSSDASENIQRIKSDYLLAKSEYERVVALFSKNVATEKNLDEARFDFESKKASYNSLVDQIEITENGYAVIVPIEGYIEQINFDLGDQLESGEELFTILNSNRLILKANVPSSHFELANNVTDACFMPEGLNSEFTVSSLNGKKLSVAASLNLQNRTVPVYFEFNNPQKQLKVGMFTEVHLRVGNAVEYVSIPESAVINEDGLKTAYIQLEGEAFEKRILKTGIVDDGFVQVIEGLKMGERVVTKGAYQVRLAELSPDSAIGHGHGH